MFNLQSAAIVSKDYYTTVGLYLYIVYVNELLTFFKKLTAMDQGLASIVSVVLKIQIHYNSLINYTIPQ